MEFSARGLPPLPAGSRREPPPGGGHRRRAQDEAATGTDDSGRLGQAAAARHQIVDEDHECAVHGPAHPDAAGEIALALPGVEPGLIAYRSA